MFSSLPRSEMCSDTASFVGCPEYFCQYLGAHLLYGQMFLVVMSCLRTGFLWWQERNLRIFVCFQVVGRKCLLSECFSIGDESYMGISCHGNLARKGARATSLERQLGCWDIAGTCWGKRGGGRTELVAQKSSVVISSLPLILISAVSVAQHRECVWHRERHVSGDALRGSRVCDTFSRGTRSWILILWSPVLSSAPLVVSHPRPGAVILGLTLPWPWGRVWLWELRDGFGKDELATRLCPWSPKAQGLGVSLLW